MTGVDSAQRSGAPSIEVIRSPQAMHERMLQARGRGQRIAFVPTMGALHAGHQSLLRQGRGLGEVLVLSIFVNPIQFGPSEDLTRYPRDEAGDLRKAAECGCDVAFCPQPAAMYPAGFQTRVEVTGLQRGLCGDLRPGHFAGVATVVLKLCHVVQPHVLLLGEKDYQQLRVVQQMAADLLLPVQVLGCPLVREADGLALSSRNAYLGAGERQAALAISRGLLQAQALHRAGERDAARLTGAALQVLAAEPGVALQYLELRDAETLAPVQDLVQRRAVLLCAALVGRTRLIDNVLL